MAPFSQDHALRLEPAPRPVPVSQPVPQTTSRAMERFTCIAERCEDTCCRDWAVEIDRSSLERMKKALARTPGGREKLVRLVVVGRPSQHTHAPAQVRMNEDGSCPMLEPNHLCSMQTAHGEAALSTACSIFPRTAMAAEGSLEVNGSLACPEVTRLVLLSEDGALDLRPATRPMLPRPYVGRVLPTPAENRYATAFGDVRTSLIKLLSTPGYPLSSRYVFAATAAERLDSVLSEVSSTQPLAARRVEAELPALHDARTLAALHRDLGGLSTPGDNLAALVATTLVGRRRLPHSPRYAALLDAVFSSLQSQALGRPAHKDDAVTPSQLWSVYRDRRQAVDARFGDRLHQLFANYTTHYLQRTPHTASPTLMDHIHQLGLHLAALRLLVCGHPDLAARLAAAPDAAMDRDVLERTTVHVVQTYTKAIGHNIEYQQAMARSVASTGGASFGRLVMLAKFL